MLLGARVTLGELASLGLPTIALAVGGVAVTIAGGWAIGRALGLQVRSRRALGRRRRHLRRLRCARHRRRAAAPRRLRPQHHAHHHRRRRALDRRHGALPALAQALGMDDRTAGVFLGASIHDVAQVVGAGFMISPDAAESATIVKLTRVVCLAPAVAVARASSSAPRDEAARAACNSPVPLFVLGFLAMMTLRSAGLISEPVAAALTKRRNGCC